MDNISGVNRGENFDEDEESGILQAVLGVQTPLRQPRDGSGEALRLSPRQNFIMKAKEYEEQELIRCKAILKKMKEACGVQRNISQTVKTGIVELEEAFSNIQSYRTRWQVAEREIRSAIPAEVPDVEKKRPASSPADQADEHKKQKQDDVAEKMQFTKVLGKRKKRRLLKEQLAKERDTEEPATSAASTTPRPAPAKKKATRMRTDAILVKSNGSSFSDIVKKIQKNVKPEETGVQIRSLRKTQAGHVLIELGSESKDKEAFRAAIGGTLGPKAVVSSLEPGVTLEIRDIPEAYDGDDVREALLRDAPELGNCRVGMTSANRRGIRAAIFTARDKFAEKLLSAGKIRIGWVVCRVRLRTAVTRCFKCLGFGHLSLTCKGPDRRDKCFKCGTSGHKQKGCNSTERCIVCEDSGAKETAHKLGSGKCAAFREALSRAKKTIR